MTALLHTAPGHDDGRLRVSSVNLLNGGLDADGSTRRLEQTAAILNSWHPHLVLVQELCAPGEDKVRRHFRQLANAVGLEPAALSPPRGAKRQHSAILADSGILEILDDGPAPARDAPCWAEAVVRVRATGTELAVTSVHAPATTANGQLAEAERLAARTAQRGRLAIAGGDWNCYTPSDEFTSEELGALDLHLRPSRTRSAEGRITARYDVHETLNGVGMADPVPALPPDRRDPAAPAGTGSHPRGRIDRFYLWPGTRMVPSVRCYHQKYNPGSDHQMLMICLDQAALATTAPAGARP